MHRERYEEIKERLEKAGVKVGDDDVLVNMSEITDKVIGEQPILPLTPAQVGEILVNQGWEALMGVHPSQITDPRLAQFYSVWVQMTMLLEDDLILALYGEQESRAEEEAE